jgi:hypothetical protein
MADGKMLSQMSSKTPERGDKPQMLPLFGTDLATRQADNPQKLVIMSEEDLLLFTLY